MVICLEQSVADLHMAQLMPLPLTVTCFSKVQIGFTFLVLAHPCSVLYLHPNGHFLGKSGLAGPADHSLMPV